MEGLTKTLKGFDKAIAQTKRETPTSFRIEYTAPYALKVHENVNAEYRNGEPKFLENAIKENKKRIGEKIANLVRKKKGLKHAIKRGAEDLLEQSNKRVPVNTGALKRSGTIFTN